MAGEAEMAGCSVFAGMGRAVFEFCYFGEIGVEDRDAVEFHLQGGALDEDLLVIPLTRRAEIAPMGWNHAITPPVSWDR